MALTSGQRLGAYEILGSLGAGGMGEVYRARDTKLQRDVAVKVLPESLAADRDRLARFEREAQLLAALNHPHIAAIYGVDSVGGTQFLVLELVDGDTLADRITRGGAFSLSEAVAIARQIGEALQAAHDKGIIHRDLKPANIALTADGQVKVLDFGLAKAIEGAPAAQSSTPAATLSPTLSLAMTEAGFILGTAAYMSPEQAKGRPADKRSDVWAFGCVLFEMLTAKRAFEGEDASDTLAGILRGEPDWKALPRGTPPHVRDVLTGCLTKDRKARLADIAVVNYLLTDARHTAKDSASTRFSGRLALGGVLTALLLIGAAVGIIWRPTRAEAPTFPSRASIVQPSDMSIPPNRADRVIAISPNGRYICWVGQGGLVLRDLTRWEPELLRGMTDARMPFWSPDSKWIGFTENSTLRKVSVTGGSSLLLANAGSQPRGASWGPDDTVVFATADPTTGLLSVAGGGGTPKVLTRPDAKRGEREHQSPSYLPNGRGVLFVITRLTPDSGDIAVLDMQTGQYTIIIPGGNRPEFVEPGYIVYAVAGVLQAVRFDPTNLAVISDPVPVLDQEVSVTTVGAAEFSVSRTGDLVYLTGEAGVSNTQRTLVWVDSTGQETPIAGAPPRAYQYPTLSHDGSRVALTLNDQLQDIWIYHFANRTFQQLTSDRAVDAQASWYPGDERLLFMSARHGPSNLYAQRSDGTGGVQRVTNSPVNQISTAIAPEGRLAVALQQNGNTGNDLVLLRLDRGASSAETGTPTAAGPGSDQPIRSEPLIAKPNTQAQPAISLDGRFLAYMSNESGRQEIIVQPFPQLDGEWPIGPGTRPTWSRDRLFYVSPSNSMMAVPFTTTPTFSSLQPIKLFDWPSIGSPGVARTYDVTSDGRRFLMIKVVGVDRLSGPSRTIQFVQNWLAELKEKLPAK